MVTTKTDQEEKKNGDDNDDHQTIDPNDAGLSPPISTNNNNPVVGLNWNTIPTAAPTAVATTGSTTTMLAPRTMMLEENTNTAPNTNTNINTPALEALLSDQVNAGDTIKARNTSPKPRHLRGVSWDLGIPPMPQVTTATHTTTTAATAAGTTNIAAAPFNQQQSNTAVEMAKPSMVNRGVSVPVPSGRPPIRAGFKNTNNYNNRFAIPKTTLGQRKTSNNDSSLGSGGGPLSPHRNRNKLGSLDNPADMELEVDAYLNEMIQQNEVQAETNLIRHLDETDPLHQHAGTGSSILGEVPMDEVQHDFIIEDNDGLILKSPTTASHQQQQSERDGNSSRNATTTTKKEQQQTTKPTEKMTHKRTMTVEQTLFGLTSALSELKSYDQVERQNHHLDEKKIDSNDIFDVAGALFDRAHKKNVPSKDSSNAVVVAADEDTSNTARPRLNTMDSKSKRNLPSSSAAPSSRWGVVKDNLCELKKSDDTNTPNCEPLSINEDDVEEGIFPENNDSEMEYSGDSDDGDRRHNDNDGGNGTDEKSKLAWMKRRKRVVNPFKHLPYANKVKEEWDVFNKFLNPRKQSLRMYVKIILAYIMIPACCIAAGLFYLGDNPPYGRCPVEGCNPRKENASASWWILFIGCRQVVIACLSKMTESLVIDFFALRTQFTLRMLGPMVTLLLVQSRGWPFLLCCFGMYNFALTVGDSSFSNHWLFWQPYIGLFNKQNPPGFVTSSLAFYRVCAVAMGVGAAVSVKRMAVGIYLGRKTFANYSQSLTSIMNKMLQLNELARLGRLLEEQKTFSGRKTSSSVLVSQVADERLHELIQISNQHLDDDNLSISRGKSFRSSQDNKSADDMDRVIDPTDIDPYTGSLTSLQKQRICDLLGQWEEPSRQNSSITEEVASVGAVMQFKRALAHMDTDFPFGGAFGVADSREACVQCSQKLYDRLMLQENGVNGMLHFNTIALIAMDRSGNLDAEKTKELIRIFRPDRDGEISLVDFVRSVDNVYKELRLLRATVAGSTKIDRALESIFNYAFYVLLACIILWVLKIDPFALFVSVSSIILAFAFMIGSASSKYFEGLLLIVVQRPYGIGDRINIANPEVPGDTAGSQGWIVEDVTLFTTTLCLAATSERATIANGMLAKSRIINGARSPNAIVYVVMRFGIETPYRKVEMFRSAVEKFVRARPREWSSMLGFRVSRIEADLGFIEYTTALRHREAWQNIVPILNSRNTMHAFCLELAKKLDMRYKNPPLPVDLKMQGMMPPQFDLRFNNEELAGEKAAAAITRVIDPPHSPGSQSYNSDSLAQVAAMFDD
ncbi:mechanosensitive ion channel [Nitzschia inconspicua]|uniref:Mechanosensitive ion channel n=1 Tax=Nitzschia inconspicua TaxID=303405 RepID=A0A9K3M2E0_9STRA|nr:mechanosensitive ion channel [Nitzschia inconspicua]KAG7372814.1 mechanosensitive ion channel [Nitzschia inconspicua]